jgi:hypothetical protein
MAIMVAKTKKHREKFYQNGLPVGSPTMDAIKNWSLDYWKYTQRYSCMSPVMQ